ncbi:MAG TPA: sigma-70 family RNA polymerase sigma factor [Flavobacteriales bacterium]|nr:sigma-70 family RNA polymerase sigma factor [Flavobacteriales bacterium]
MLILLLFHLFSIVSAKQPPLPGNKPYNRTEELIYIKKAQADPRHFGILYDAYHKPILIFIYGRVKDKETASDITQQVFLKAMINIKKYQDRGFPFSSWLYRIAMNEVNMHYREQKITEVEIREKDAASLMEEMGDAYTDEKIALCLDLGAKLPEEQNRIIEMRFFDRLSFQEIGDILGIAEANAKMRVYRTLEKLKTELLNLLNR